MRCTRSSAQVNWYSKEDVRVVGDDGDLFKRSLGAVESWETPRAPFEVGPAASRTGPGVPLLLRLQSCKCAATPAPPVLMDQCTGSSKLRVLQFLALCVLMAVVYTQPIFP